MPAETAGNQKWKGAAPNLIKRAIIKSKLVGVLKIHPRTEPLDIDKSTAKIKSSEENAWTKKYLIHLSTLVTTPRLKIIGIKLIKLTSNATHAPNQVGEEITIKTDNNKTNTNNNIEGINMIRIRI